MLQRFSAIVGDSIIVPTATELIRDELRSLKMVVNDQDMPVGP